MPTLLIGVLGALLGIMITAVLDPIVHVGLHIVEGTARYVVSALAGASCAIAIRRAVRATFGL